MDNETLLFFLVCAVLLLLLVIVYQRLAFRAGTRKSLKQISEKLSDILEKDTDEKIMVFTDHKELADLCGQINRMLLDRQKIKTDYIRQEISVRKMLANISHDIKTPLTVILGYLEIMRMENGEDESLRKVEAKAKQVMELISQFFTLAKLEAGDRKPVITQIDIAQVCRENVLSFYELLVRKEFTVDISVPDISVPDISVPDISVPDISVPGRRLMAQGERDSIDRILNNLISNALRYGADGKYIGIFLREEKESVCIDVVDKGRGIEKEFAQSVFERLYTLEDSRSRQIQGNGLGLTIARRLAREMGGDLVLESRPGVRTVRLRKSCAERNL